MSYNLSIRLTSVLPDTGRLKIAGAIEEAVKELAGKLGGEYLITLDVRTSLNAPQKKAPTLARAAE